MYERGLAYRKKSRVNWCPKCATVLANEQVVDGCCWRHEDTPVVERELEQWFLKTTAYAEPLAGGHEGAGVLARTRADHAAELDRQVAGDRGAFSLSEICGEPLPVFTTRVDTIFGCTAVFVAPEHPLVEKLIARSKAPEKLRQAVERIESLQPCGRAWT